MTEQAPEYLTDAQEMMGSGYDQPTVVIEPPRTVIARQNGRMVEVDEPAWIKFSTDFKGELKTLDEYSLKVFLYISLSVNWKTGTAWPGLRKIAEDTGMDKDTVAKAVANLEKLTFLTIQKRFGDSNIYKPVRYISIGTVPPEGTPPSDENKELSHETPGLSDASRVNLHNKNNKKEQESIVFEKANRTVDFILGSLSPKAIQDSLATYFKLTPNWEVKFSRQWMQWAMGANVSPDQIEKAANLWRSDRRFNWSVPTLKGIQEHWLELNAEPQEPEYTGGHRSHAL
jgi:hypothetical protein